MYADIPIGDWPMIRPMKKSTFHATSGSRHNSIMPASSGLSSHSAAAVASRTMSENHRKLAGPYFTQYTGTMTSTIAVYASFSHNGIRPAIRTSPLASIADEHAWINPPPRLYDPVLWPSGGYA